MYVTWETTPVMVDCSCVFLCVGAEFLMYGNPRKALYAFVLSSNFQR